MIIATWNVNSIKVRLHAVLQYLSEENPDVLVLQETKIFAHADSSGMRWRVARVVVFSEEFSNKEQNMVFFST